MVHKRYEKRGGKVFGPYYYESYRVGNKVKKRYIGGEKEYRVWLGDKNKKELKKSRTTSYFSVINKGKHFSFILVGLFFFLLILFFAFLLYNPVGITGKAGLEIKDFYISGENISGILKLSLKKGELLPIDSKLIVEQLGETREISLSELIFSNFNGNFYTENKEISGSGEGYGFEGEKINYPVIRFKLKISGESKAEEPFEEQVETPSPSEIPAEIPAEVPGEKPVEQPPETPAELPVEQPIPEQPSSEQPSAPEQPASQEAEQEAPVSITGSAIEENENIVEGEVSKNNDFVYELSSGKTAEIKKNSVEIEKKDNEGKIKYEKADENLIRLQISDGKAIVSTDYSEIEKGFGKDYLSDETEILEINLNKLGIEAQEGTLKISLVYNDILIDEKSKEINVIGEIPEINKTIINKTLVNETLSPENLTLTENLSSFKIKNSRIVLNRPVKWLKKVEFLENQTEIIIEIPKQAENISIKRGIEVQESLNELEEYDKIIENADKKEILEGGITGFVSIDIDSRKGFFSRLWKKLTKGITGRAIFEEEIKDKILEGENSKTLELTGIVDAKEETAVEYYTEAPAAAEENTSNGKIITVSAPDELNYTDVLAYTLVDENKKIPVNSTGKLRLYWVQEKALEVPENAGETPLIENETNEQIISNGREETERNAIEPVIEEECYDNETEILTESGWKYFYELNGSEKVMTLNVSSGEKEWQLPSEKQEFENRGEMYRIELEDRQVLSVSREHKVYAGELSKKSVSFSVVNTSTTLVTDDSWKCGSFDQIGQFNLSDNAKYCLSSWSEISELAQFNCCGETLAFRLTNPDNISFILSNLSLETSSNSQSSSQCSSNSFKINLCEYNSKECLCANLLVNESFFNKENAILASITNLIYNSPDSFSNLFLTSLANLRQSSSVSLLFLVNSSSSSNNLALSSCLRTSCFASSDQLTQENSFISDLTLSGIEKVIDAIYNSPPCSNSFNFFNCSSFENIILLNISDHLIFGCLSINSLNLSGKDNVIVAILTPSNYVYKHNYVDVYKSFCSELNNFDFKLMPVTKAYSSLQQGREIYFLDSENKPVRIKSITKENNYTGRIYDVDVSNDIVLVRRNNNGNFGSAVWSGNSNREDSTENIIENQSLESVIEQGISLTGQAVSEISGEQEDSQAQDENVNETIRTETAKTLVNYTAYDLDEDGYIDYVEWSVPHLSNQTYELVIEITKAEHLDENKSFVSDIYEQVKALDGNWSEEIPNEHYVRVTFERNLTKNRDITIYARAKDWNNESNSSISAEIEVYPENNDLMIAKFSGITSENWYKVYLTNLNETESYDVFELRVIGSVEFDYIVDPTAITNIEFISPTLASGSSTTNTSIEINVSIVATNISEVNFNWNGTNYTIYNDSLVLMFNFENLSALGENATRVVDVSKYKDNGNLQNGAIINSSNGKYGWGISFDGINDRINAGSNSSLDNLNNTGMTITAWINFRAGYAETGTFGMIAAKAGLTGDPAGSWWFGIANSGANAGNLRFNKDTGASDVHRQSVEAVPVDSWQYVTLTWNGTNVSTGIRFYINGNETTYKSPTNGSATPVSDASNDLYIGSDIYAGRSINATLDELGIYNRVLSQEEIIELYMLNLQKYNQTQWYLYVNQSKNATSGLDNATYTYFASAKDADGNENMTETRTIIIGGAAADTIYPTFSNYWDNNASLIISGTGLFNVTLTNTNGTVLLEINNTNITATNITANVYNVSYSFTGNGTYSYKWHSWGNGTDKNYNVSDTRSYFVNSSALSSCLNLNVANTIYTLIRNVSSTGTCFNVTAQNVTLNCRGYAINFSSGNTDYTYGIYSDNYNTSVKNCFIKEANASMGTATKYGIYFSGVTDGLIQNNSVTIYEGYSTSVYLTGANNFIISGNILRVNGSTSDGLYFSGNNSQIVYNNVSTIDGTSDSFSFSSSRSVNVSYNNFTTYGGGNGISLSSVSDSIIYDNTIMTLGVTGDGIQFSGSNNITISKIDVDTNDVGSDGINLFSGSNNFTIIDSYLNTYAGGTFSFRISNTTNVGVWNFTNVTEYGGVFSKLWENGNGTLNVFWYLDVYANNTNGDALQNINISVWNKNNVFQFSELSAANGYITKKTLQEYSQNRTITTFYTNYTINATGSGYNRQTRSVNLTLNRLEVFSMNSSSTTVTLTAGNITEDGYINFDGGSTYTRDSSATTFLAGYEGGGVIDRAYIEFNTNSIPDNAVINSVKLNVSVSEGSANTFNITEIKATVGSQSDQDLYTDIGNGTTYSNPTYTGLTSWVSTDISLANTTLQAQLNNNWFAIGIKDRDESNVDTASIQSSESVNDSQLIVTYTLDTIYPVFSNYWDNNNSVNGSGTGLFNVTLANTNGTVLLEINNTNITATNITSNVYNASYSFTGNGTYSYKWHSWGDGGARNYNVSNTRSYTVNPDLTAPLITILSPLNITYGVSLLTFNISANENLSFCKVTLNDWAANYTMTINATKRGANYTNTSIGSGSYSSKFWCNDSSGNINNTEQVTFAIDVTAPGISINYPLNNSNISDQNWILLNWSISDTRNMEVWVYGTNSTNFNSKLLYHNKSLSSGNYSYNWTGPVIDYNLSDLVFLFHFDNLSEYNENSSFVYDFTGKHNATCASGFCPKFEENSGKFAGSFNYSYGTSVCTDDCFFNISDANDLNLSSNATLIAWVYFAGIPSDDHKIVGYRGTAGDYWYWDLTGDDANYQGYMRFWDGSFGGNGALYGNTNLSIANLNKWVQVAVVRSGTSLTFYLNGIADGTVTLATANALDPSGNLIIGDTEQETTEGWNGYIDELAFFNRTITSSEIASYYSLSYIKYYWIVNVSDSFNYNNSGIYNFNLTGDKIIPKITIISPLNQTYTTIIINFSVSLNENSSWCGFSLNGAANITMTRFNDTYFNFTNSSMKQGSHSIVFACNDTSGNMNSSSGTIVFSIDSIFPNVTLNAPVNYANLTNVSVNFNCTSYDNSNLKNVTLYFNASGGGSDSYTQWIANRSTWYYNDTNVLPASDWVNTSMYLNWKSGPSYLATSAETASPGVNTTLTMGSYAYITYYFMKNFTITDADKIINMSFDIDYDDAYAVWINGYMINSSNSSCNWFSHTTLCLPYPHNAIVDTSGATAPIRPVTNLNSTHIGYLVNGINNISVAIKQGATTSSDAAFELRLYGWESTGISWHANQTINISGIRNETIFNLNLTDNSTYSWNCLAFDDAGNSNWSISNFTFNVNTSAGAAADTTSPNISIISPINGRNYSVSNINFSISSDENLSFCSVTLNNWGTNYTMSVNTSLRGANYTNTSIADGSYTSRYWCNDTSGNINNSEQVTFSIDTTFPLIVYGSGTEANGTSVARNWTYIDVLIEEENFDKANFKIFNSTGIFNSVVTPNRTSFILGSYNRIINNSNLALGADTSSVAYNPSSDSLFMIHNGNCLIDETNLSGESTRTITLTSFVDCEGIGYLNTSGNDYWFAVVEEGKANLTLIRINSSITSITMGDSNTIHYDLGLGNLGNLGLEGISYDRKRDVYYAVKEKSLMQVYQFNLSAEPVATTLFNATTVFNGTLKPGDLVTANFTDLSDLYYDENTESLLILSHESQSIARVNLTGSVLENLSVSHMTQPEGITFDDYGDYLYVVGEADFLSTWKTKNFTSFFNFTNLPDGTYTYNVTANDSAGNENVTETRIIIISTNTAPNNPTPSLVSLDGSNKTNIDLNCSSLITDPDSGNTLNVSIQWFKNNTLNFTLDYNNSYANGTMFSALLDDGNTTKGENWSCGIRLYDGKAYSNWVNSTNITILNSLPTISLTSPANSNITTNRTPIFIYSGSDADSDSLSYEINLTCYESGSIVSAGSQYINKDTVGSSTSYTLTNYLKCLKDNNQLYNWTVRAYDGEGFGSWNASERNISIQSSVSISLPRDSVNFGSMNVSQSENTSDDEPLPPVLRNDGNAELNISINFTSLWDSVSMPDSSFQYRIRNTSVGCFVASGTQTAWANSPLITANAINRLNFTSGYQTGCSNSSIDIYVSVPAQEPPGNKSSLITLTSSLGEPKVS